MRVFKWRIWDKANKRMYDKVLIGNYPETVPLVWDKYTKVWYHIEPSVCVLMQNTGFKDMENQEIYEGDIVGYIHGEYLRDGIDVGEVYWCDEQNLFYNNLDLDYDDAWEKSYIQVMGNIYENPDLIDYSFDKWVYEQYNKKINRK